jgi:hypothetical protein
MLLVALDTHIGDVGRLDEAERLLEVSKPCFRPLLSAKARQSSGDKDCTAQPALAPQEL